MLVTRSGKDTNERKNEGPQVFTSSGESNEVGGISPEAFQRILKERKAESSEIKLVAEMKRLKGLKQIHERNSRTGVEPLEHFPEVIWFRVLDELTPHYKANLCQVHPFFPNLMESNQIRDILFPLILEHNKNIVQKYFVDWDWNLDTALMELRRVSKSMRDAVGKWFEDDLLTLIELPMETARRKRICWSLDAKPIPFWLTIDEGKLQKILDIKKPAKRDILVDITTCDSRGLDVDVRRGYFNLFVANVTKALEEIGDQIWRFEFKCVNVGRLGVSRTQICSHLKEWLCRLPNVKSIYIHFYAFGPFESIETPLWWNEGFPQFPAFHALTRLDFHSFGEYKCVELISDAIISANPQVKIIRFGNLDHQFISRPFMKALNLESCQVAIDPCSNLFENFETAVGSSNWNLKTLELYFCRMDVSIDSLIRFLNHFPTLENVFLYGYQIKFSDDEIDFLRLPNLIHFVFRSESTRLEHQKYEKYDGKAHFFFSLQFMLYCSKLESLIWTQTPCSTGSLCHQIQSYEKEHPEGMVNFGGGFKDLNHSNLWDVFPNLKYVHVDLRYNESDRTIQTFCRPRTFLSSLP